MFKYNMFSLKCNKNTLTFFDHFSKLKRAYLQSMTIVQVMGIDAEQLLGQGMLLNAVVVVKPRLGAPADVKRGVDVGLAPLHEIGRAHV